MDELEAAWENAVDIPLSDPPEHVVTLRVAREVLGRRELYQIMHMVSGTAVPPTVQVVFTGASLPPPLLVTIGEAAEALSVSRKHVESLIVNGWLSPIRYAESGGRKPRAEWKKALASGHWPGWDYRILWTELVAMLSHAKETEHIPTDTPPPHLDKWHRKEGTVVTEDGRRIKTVKYHMNITDRAQEILRDDTKDETGAYRWVTVNQLQDMLNAWITTGRFVPYPTVRNALWKAHEKGWIEKRRLDRSKVPEELLKSMPSRGPLVQYRWIPEDVRREESFEQPPAGYEVAEETA